MTPESARYWAHERAHQESRLVQHDSETERVMWEAKRAQRYYEEMVGAKK